MFIHVLTHVLAHTDIYMHTHSYMCHVPVPPHGDVDMGMSVHTHAVAAQMCMFSWENRILFDSSPINAQLMFYSSFGASVLPSIEPDSSLAIRFPGTTSRSIFLNYGK